MGRTSATQKEKAEGSVGMIPTVFERRWTTQGAVPSRKRSRKDRHVDMRSWFDGEFGCMGTGVGVVVGVVGLDEARGGGAEEEEGVGVGLRGRGQSKEEADKSSG